MSHRIQVTADGSHTIESLNFESTYHSKFGAIQESLTVFVEAGLRYIIDRISNPAPIRILELGFGTGLNAWLTLCAADTLKLAIDYSSVELFPISEEMAGQLNYPAIYSPLHEADFVSIHKCSWSEWVSISPQFQLHKIQTDVLKWKPDKLSVDIVYYDAFGPTTQPELWSEQILSTFIDCLVPGGVFVTYCAKGEVRRTLQRLGLTVERLPGPPGKREILRGIKQ